MPDDWEQQGQCMKPVVRVSILRCPPERFAELRQMAIEADPILRPGIEAMAGLLDFYFGADESTSSLTNVSLWTSLEAAKQLDTFQPMLDLGKPFAEKGATFERPIMNYATLWQLKGSTGA
jgi:hypothetical protein